MLKNYLKIAWRSLRKNKVYTVINIVGLTLGMACCLVIALYVQDELSYDRYHTHGNRIYRVLHGNKPEETTSDSLTGKATSYKYDVWGNAPVGKALKSDFPEIQEVVQFSGRVAMLLKYGERAFQEENVFFADASTFDVFSWNLIAGNPKTALKTPYSAVLTESAARKYFGNEDPIGKTIEGGNTGGRAAKGIYTVTGVMQDVPGNSHFTFDILMSMSSFRQSWPEVFDQWGYVDFYTYFLTTPHFNSEALSTKVPGFLKKYGASQNGSYHIAFEPLYNAYLRSDAGRQPGITGNLSNIYIFSIIGLFTLIIACINFMNLATARSMERAKEVGIRKVVGAKRKELFYQFMSESLTMVLLAAVLTLFAIAMASPWIHELTGKKINIDILLSAKAMIFYIVTVVVTALLAGGYPALILSGFRPITVLKGVFTTSAKGANMRKGLVVFQFSLSLALIVGTIIIFYQLKHLQNKQMGFQKEQMLVVDFNHDEQVLSKLDVIKNTLMNDPDVISVTASRSVPGSYFPNANTVVESPEGNMSGQTTSLYEVDVDFIPNFGLEMAAGRAYSRDFPVDSAHSLVINEASARLFGYTDPHKIIGKRFAQWGKEGQVIGVVKDFNYLSLHQQVEPLALRLEPGSSRFFTLRIQSKNLPGTIERIGGLWSSLVPQHPFIYNFLDDTFDRQYQADFRFQKLFTGFSILAILIACLGLMGLATYTARQRTKEIGIRKVLGASVGSVISLLSKDFVKLVLMAFLIASPVALWAMNKWLEDFAYRIEIEWWMFVLAGTLIMVIALLTISFQAVKAALMNPIKSLKTD